MSEPEMSATSEKANSLRHRRLAYKSTGMPTTAEGIRAQRRARDQDIRQQQREQLISGKRFRHRRLSLGELDSEDDTDGGRAEETDQETEQDEKDMLQLQRALGDHRRDQRVQALKRLSKRLTNVTPAIKRYLLNESNIDQLTQFLTSSDAEEQLQALWCITNIAAGPKEICHTVVKTAPYLISFLNSSDTSLCNQATWALGNLALEDDEVRATLRANGVVLPLVKLLDTKEEELIRTVGFALSSLLHGQDPHPQDYIHVGLLPKLKEGLMSYQHPKTISELAWVLTYLTHCGDAICAQVAQAGMLPIILQKTNELKDTALVLPLIRTLGNFYAGPDTYAEDCMRQPEFLILLTHLLRSALRPVRKETLWMVSNLTAGQGAYIEQCMNNALLEALYHIVLHDAFDLRKEAAYSLMNLAQRGESFFCRMPFDRLLPAFLEFLRSQDEELIRLGLGFVQLALAFIPQASEILEAAGVPDALDSAVFNQNEALHRVAGHLLDQIFREYSPSLAT